jgi:hypothetical protein
MRKMDNLITTNNIRQTGDFAAYNGKFWVDLYRLQADYDPDAIHSETVQKTIQTMTRIIIAAVFIPIFIGAVMDRYYLLMALEVVIVIWLYKKLGEQWGQKLTDYDMRKRMRETNKFYAGTVVNAGYRRQIVKTETGNALKEFCILQCEFETNRGTQEQSIHFSLDQNLPESVRDCFSGLIPDEGQAEIAIEMPLLVGREVLFQLRRGQYTAEFMEITQEDYEHGVANTEQKNAEGEEKS